MQLNQHKAKRVTAWLRAGALAMLFILTANNNARAASTEEVVALLLPPNLVAAHIKTAVGDALSREFIGMLGLELMPNRAAPKGRFSDEDAKNILEKLDQIIVSATAPIEDLVASRAMDVQSDQVNEFARYKDRWAALLESKAAINWLRRHNALQAETASFGHLGLVLWALRPDKIRFPFVNASPEYQFLVGELYATRREATYLMLNTPDIVAVLPSSIRVQELRALEAETRTVGMPALRSLGFHDGFRGIDGPIYRTVLRVADRLTPQLVQLAQPAREQLEQLASKYRGNPRKP